MVIFGIPHPMYTFNSIGDPLASADGEGKIGKVRMLRVHEEG